MPNQQSKIITQLLLIPRGHGFGGSEFAYVSETELRQCVQKHYLNRRLHNHWQCHPMTSFSFFNIYMKKERAKWAITHVNRKFNPNTQGKHMYIIKDPHSVHTSRDITLISVKDVSNPSQVLRFLSFQIFETTQMGTTHHSLFLINFPCHQGEALKWFWQHPINLDVGHQVMDQKMVHRIPINHVPTSRLRWSIPRQQSK